MLPASSQVLAVVGLRLPLCVGTGLPCVPGVQRWLWDPRSQPHSLPGTHVGFHQVREAPVGLETAASGQPGPPSRPVGSLQVQTAGAEKMEIPLGAEPWAPTVHLCRLPRASVAVLANCGSQVLLPSVRLINIYGEALLPSQGIPSLSAHYKLLGTF